MSLLGGILSISAGLLLFWFNRFAVFNERLLVANWTLQVQNNTFAGPAAEVAVNVRVRNSTCVVQHNVVSMALSVADPGNEFIKFLLDDVITMYRGEIVGRYDRSEVTTARILADITHPPEARPRAERAA